MEPQSTSPSFAPPLNEDVNMTQIGLDSCDAAITETTSDNTTTATATTTNTKRQVHLPNELLMKICEQFVLPPHLVSIRPTPASDQNNRSHSHSHSHSSFPIFASDHTHIPPIMRVNKCAWDVFTKNQKLSFHGLLTRPSYLNSRKDILYFANLATLDAFVVTKDALKECRKVGVKRLAVNGLSASLIIQDPSDELRRPVPVLAHACRLFGHLSNLYLVHDNRNDSEDRAHSLDSLKAGIEERFTHAQAFWISFEVVVGGKVENKWVVPEIEWVSENELKRMAPSEMMKFIAKPPKPAVVEEQATLMVRRSRTIEDLEAEYPIEYLVMRKALESNAKRVQRGGRPRRLRTRRPRR